MKLSPINTVLECAKNIRDAVDGKILFSEAQRQEFLVILMYQNGSIDLLTYMKFSIYICNIVRDKIIEILEIYNIKCKKILSGNIEYAFGDEDGHIDIAYNGILILSYLLDCKDKESAAKILVDLT